MKIRAVVPEGAVRVVYFVSSLKQSLPTMFIIRKLICYMLLWLKQDTFHRKQELFKASLTK